MARTISRRAVMTISAAAAATATTASVSQAMELITTPEPRDAIDDIQRVVARHYRVSIDDIVGPLRVNPIVRARQTGMYLARLMSGEALYMIGTKFGGRDALNVVHAARRTEALRLTEPGFNEAIAKMAAAAIEAIERNGHGPAAKRYAERAEVLPRLLEGKAYCWERREIQLAKKMLTDDPTFYETLT